MSVFISVGCFGHSVGTTECMESIFETIAYNLENRKWGSRFPIIMNEFYNEKLKVEHIDSALNELDIIEKELKKIKIDQVVWVKCKELRHPAIVHNINQYATNLADYFINCDGENMFKLIRYTMERGRRLKKDVVIFKL